jgi:Holliday junction resolvasome RuvABC DNA-binding subunit
LGYRESEARAALDRVPGQKTDTATADLIKEALKQIS